MVAAGALFFKDIKESVIINIKQPLTLVFSFKRGGTNNRDAVQVRTAEIGLRAGRLGKRRLRRGGHGVEDASRSPEVQAETCGGRSTAGATKRRRPCRQSL